jgi:uncharacterized repeat protein (TIGR02543 family)/prepilin-type N-terminal cleavage/methylation domain-containing protein
MFKHNALTSERRGTRGLTLVEMLITIAVIAVVAAISIPTISNVIGSSRSSAADTMQAEVNSFIEKYSASGKIEWDENTRTFTAWVDKNGDGIFTDTDPREIIETLTVGTEFSVEVDNPSSPTSIQVTESGGSRSVTFIAGFVDGPANTIQTIQGSSTAALASNEFIRPNYSFSEWNTAINGSGVSYAEGESYSASDDLVLYAQWSGNTYSLTYNYAGATAGNDVPNDSYTTGETEITLTTPSKTGYTLAGWNNSEAGDGDNYGAGTDISLTSNTTLYAQWNANNYSLTYAYGSATGNTSLESSSYSTGGTEIVLPEPTRSGSTFLGWNTIQDGTGTLYNPGSSVSLSQSATYYARWSTTGDVSQTFEYTGSGVYYTAPAAAENLTFTISGAAGGRGGMGGRVTGEFINDPTGFWVFVGGEGIINADAPGGWNGGGRSGGSRGNEGSGGGASDIRSGTGLSERIVVAGGGGGGGGYAGAAGGVGGNLVAQNGGSGQGGGGGGGRENSGGSAGASNGGSSAQSGGFGVAGTGGSSWNAGGGGGGGGWYGGGGGGGDDDSCCADGGGGGGGSSFANTSLVKNISHQAGVQNGAGRITISYSSVTEDH